MHSGHNQEWHKGSDHRRQDPRRDTFDCQKDGYQPVADDASQGSQYH